jgi:Cu+-exporting ATPase
MATAKFVIDEMHCGSCVKRVSDVLRHLPGITPRSVEVGTAEVEYEPASASPATIAAALTAAGYPAHPRLSSISLATAAKTTKDRGCGCCE